MAADDTSSTEMDWSNLLDDLLGMIRARVASPRGRVCFAAVCRSWRAAASQHMVTPALPLLVLSLKAWGKRNDLYCHDEGRVFHVPLPSKLHNTRFCGTYDGGWIAAITIPSTLGIVNLFSSVEVVLSTKQRDMAWPGRNGRRQLIRRIIFSEAPTSSACILAALTTDHDKVALCRVGCPGGGWTIHGCDREEFCDIVFHHGELYGLTRRGEKLFKFDIGINQDGAPVVTAAHPLDVQSCDAPIASSYIYFTTYIFGLHGKLAMAMMTRWFENHNPFFKVFELAVTTDDAHDYEWKEVCTLGDCALFLGQTCSSRVVHVQEGWRDVVEKNHIYYSNYRNTESKEYQEFNEEVHLARSGYGDDIYCRKDAITDGHGHGKELFPSVRYYTTSRTGCPMWCFPPDF
ncbi:putative F-box protein At3g25750 [Lolium perenne]|uniref:putative F-box protein At3g25750 n=1 Tax=Lolium perenne TaxID=4522 RepID=UPI0021F60CE4|nr:uncharacterized protein LOC127339077 [Lolium perenne]